jgi:hypothetical protein
LLATINASHLIEEALRDRSQRRVEAGPQDVVLRVLPERLIDVKRGKERENVVSARKARGAPEWVGLELRKVLQSRRPLVFG